MNDEQNQAIDAGAVGEAKPQDGGGAEPTTDEVQSMYDELGIEAKAPSVKGRPKSTDVRGKKSATKDAGSAKAGKQGDADDKANAKDAPAANTDDDSGNPSDTKGKEKRSDDREVSEKSEETGDRVRKGESSSKGNPERDGEGDSDKGTPGSRQNSDEQGDSTQEGEGDEGKRPGKSNPEVERRFQKLTSDVRERDQEISRLQEELKRATQEHRQAQVSHADPEYTVEDFRRVRDEDGNVLELTQDEAELAWRRWQDGYNQRQAEREAQYNHEQEQERRQAELSEQMMRSSVEAYDTLVGILDNYPALNPKSPEFDQAFSDQVMPIIEDAILYAPGTEPGSGQQPVIVGVKMNPENIIKAMNQIQSAKRSLPVNGLNDSVDSRSNVSVPHSRSSDPTVNAANDLYRELGIEKRL